MESLIFDWIIATRQNARTSTSSAKSSTPSMDGCTSRLLVPVVPMRDSKQPAPTEGKLQQHSTTWRASHGIPALCLLWISVAHTVLQHVQARAPKPSLILKPLIAFQVVGLRLAKVPTRTLKNFRTWAKKKERPVVSGNPKK